MTWKLKKAEEEFMCPDVATLKQWGKEGRISIDDYVFNPILNQWLYAKDVAELQGYFSQTKKQGQAKQLKSISIALGLISLPFLLLAPPFGGLLLISAAVCAVMYHVKNGTVI